MLKIKKQNLARITLTMIAVMIAGGAYGQRGPTVQDLLNQGASKYDPSVSISVNDAEKIKEQLNTENYIGFFKSINELKTNNKNEYEKILLSQRDGGHVPVYWLLADLYSGGTEKEQELSKKFLYIALIMTQQDSSLCVDQTAKQAARILLDYFKDAEKVAKRENQNNAKIIQDAIFYIRNLPVRAHPRWACVYGAHVNNYSPQSMVISKDGWERNRQAVLDKYISYMEINK